jgi:hypothetical protein
MLACTRDVAHATAFDYPDTGRDMTDRYGPWRGDMPFGAAVGSPAHYRQPDRDDSARARRFRGNKDNAEGAYTTMHLRSMWDSAMGPEHPGGERRAFAWALALSFIRLCSVGLDAPGEFASERIGGQIDIRASRASQRLADEGHKPPPFSVGAPLACTIEAN